MAFAIALPVLALLVGGAVDLAAVSASKAHLQGAADAAALNAANQLGISEEAGVKARADAFVRAELKNLANVTYTVDTKIAPKTGSVTVAIDANRPSFFANLLPPGGWDMAVTATAAPMGRRPLCVLSTSTSGSDGMTMNDTAQISAPECMIQSNDDILVGSGARLTAAAVQSTGAASGAITPAAQVGAPAIPDPFASMAIKPDNMPCQLGDLLSILGVLGGTFYIPPGVHCGNISIGKNQKVILQPGEHYFLKSKLVLRDNAELQGEDVVIIFDSKSDFQFTEQSTIRLKGRKNKLFAGFVIATTHENKNTFEISSDNARELLGTIYVPSARLLITGKKNDVADQSAWTVILAKAIEMQGSARLVVNAAYAGSGVPVPKGVGPMTSNVALQR